MLAEPEFKLMEVLEAAVSGLGPNIQNWGSRVQRLVPGIRHFSIRAKERN